MSGRLPYDGLNQEQVYERVRAGLSNKPVDPPSKSIREIVFSNVFTYFNFVFIIIAILLILVGSFRDLTFLPVIIANSLIGIFQELRAKQILDKLTVLHAPKARVVRAGSMQVITTEKLVLDDVVIFKAGDQIQADAELLSGDVFVNESLLTGEADEIHKKKGDNLLSGSFIVSGECYAKLVKVGADSYISKLTLKAKAIKTGEQSEIIRSLNNLVRLIGIAIIPIAIMMFAEQYILRDMPAKMSVQSMVAAVIGMIPEGLFLLASVTLALSTLRLAQKQVLVHDMKCIETLARTDVLCVDKTGTITTADMKVVESEWIGASNSKFKDVYEGLIAEIVGQLNPDNATMAALKKFFKRNKKSMFRTDDYSNVVKTIGFSSKFKYSGVEFNAGSFVIGAPQFIAKDDFDKIRDKVEKYSKHGYRVLLVAKYDGHLEENKALSAKITPLAIVVLANKIRETAPKTFKYFAEQGVAVKVISGDDAVTVSEVAKQAGIENADQYIDASTLKTDEAAEEAILKYTVFGRVTPEQKRIFVKALQKAGHTVAMTGDGVNDVLALKDADCSIAMASGADAAVQASQLVLLESDFSKMPQVVREGRQVVNNLERSGSLFLVKNIFSLVMAIITIFLAITYPMIPTQVSMVTMFTIGIPSFLLAQIPNENLIRGKFILNVLHKATPAALTNLAMISIMMVAGRVMNLRFEVLSTCCTMVWAVVGLTYLYRICKPFDIYKKIIFALCTGGMIFSMIFLKNLFGLERDLGFEGWMLVTIVAILTIPMLKFQAWLIEKIIGLYEKYIVKTVEKLPSISEKVDQAHENREQRVAKHFTKFAAWRDGHKGKWLGK